ncbi:MAG: diaminopimelate epimerase [Halieaceae bacterium]|nr:diaminopimelate epimerase [Halieaceae bacterium]
MRLYFTKMHGIGNDFVVIDLVTQSCTLRAEDIRKLADRHCGVGCDQVLVVEPPQNANVDFRYRIYNADGEEVEQCGNGARCFARFVREKKLTGKRVISVETASGVIELRVLANHEVEVQMAVPEFEPDHIPFKAPARADRYLLQIAGHALEIGAVSMGNPHALLRVDSAADADVARLGPAIESHPDFPRRVNAGFMEVVSREFVRLRVYERGAGETLACGSGACAAVAYGISRGWLSESVTVELPGGKLSLSWAGEGQPVIMTGPTAVVFEGSIKI